jgi:hypothetical protein
MSAVKKTAKAGLSIFMLLALVVVAGGVYVYMNMGSIARQITEEVASNALGVPVSIAAMDISLEHRKVVVRDIRVANPQGYQKPYAMTVETITVNAESFSKDLLTFARIDVVGTNVNLEVSEQSTNLSDLKENTVQSKSAPTPSTTGQDIKVIVKTVTVQNAQLTPSITLMDKDLAFVTVPDIRLQGIGVKENGVLASEAVSQIIGGLMTAFSKSANQAGFLQGLSLEALNDMGVSTIDVFQKNLKENFDEDVDQLKKGLKGLFGNQ